MTTEINRTFYIKNGPSEMDLMLSLFRGTAIYFDLDRTRNSTYRFSIYQLRRGDGFWAFKAVLEERDSGIPKGWYTEGTYRTTDRQGTLNFSDPATTYTHQDREHLERNIQQLAEDIEKIRIS